MSKLTVNQNQKEAIINLQETVWGLRQKYYKIMQPVEAILNKLELNEKNELVAKATVAELNILVEKLEEIPNNIAIQDDKLEGWNDVTYETFLKTTLEDIEFTIFYIGKVATRLEIDFAYQQDVRILSAALWRTINSFTLIS